jgi:hypothetical protein
MRGKNQPGLQVANPPIKLNLGQQIGAGLLIANHLDQSLWWANQKHRVAVRSYLLHSFLHSFLQVQSVDGPFTREPKPFSWAKPAAFDIFSSNYTVQDHILSTAGDAGREHLYFTKDPITMINQSITINFFWLIFWNLHSPRTSLQKTHFHTTIILTSSKIWMEVLYLSPLSLKIWTFGGFFGSHQVPNVFPKMFLTAPHFCLISCAHSCPLFNWIGEQKKGILNIGF